MPLRFRSVVPYTLPGVLVLMGWWWYISRKKERITSHKSLERIPVSVDSLNSPTEGRNGLVEEGMVSPTNDAALICQHTSKDGHLIIGNQKPQEVNAQILMPDNNATQEQNAVAALYHVSVKSDPENIMNPYLTVLHSSNNEGFDSHESEKSPLSVLIIEPQEVKEPVPDSMLEASISPFQSVPFDQVKVDCSTSVKLANAKRPEPEGEVASQEVSVPCVAQPLKEMVSKVTQNVTTLDIDAQKMSTPLFFHQHDLTSTPIYSAPPIYAHIEESTTPCHPSEEAIELPGQQLCSTANKEELELLAAGLITEVISAATQEVFGVASCQDPENGQPGSSCSMLLANVGSFTQEPITVNSATPMGCEFRAAAMEEDDKHRIINGFTSTVMLEPSKVNETDVENAWSGLRPMMAHFIQLPNPVSKDVVDEIVMAEGSACSTCLSEDGTSRDNLCSSRPDNKVDLFSDIDMSRREIPPPNQLAETATEAAVLDLTGRNTLEELCEIKNLNGIGLRNGAHRTGEMETDQSGVWTLWIVAAPWGSWTARATMLQASSSEHIIWEIEVPKHLVGRLIGKQGRYVSLLKQNSAAKIYISTLPYTQEFQICHIEGTQQQVDKALSLIGKKFKDLDLTNLYAPPPSPLSLPSLPMTSWLLLPSGVTVEVIVVNIVSAGHVFVQQHTHPTYHALRSLDQQMFLCYSQPGAPTLPSPAEVGVICAAPSVEGAWWRAQVITFYKETNEVEIRYVDYGGYDRVKIDTLRQIRSDFVTLPFQGAEVLLDNIAPQPEEERFSTEANSALEDLTRGVALLAQVSNYDNNTGLPLIQLWNMVGDELISINRTLAERGFSTWVDSF
ncbi:A-kinase anchor protein 1, mitochondrial [Merluccius polli]|uniref:A-kinase anchor protein 1, mitochondrial n=1 Tax=Merluccius polli TaxID=89951 RepID=A0AA47NTM4_MERPO|nr:A-kinase anchor protein 1, mitochondrial [Merluccius polli]